MRWRIATIAFSSQVILISGLMVCASIFLAFSASMAYISIVNSGQISYGPRFYIGQYANGTYYAFDRQNYINDPSYASALINNAMLSTSAQGGGAIVIRNGSYLLNVALIPQSNVNLTVLPGATIYEVTPANLGASIALLSANKGIQNFILDGGTWNANKGSLSDHRGSSTWNSNFGKYLGIAFYSGSHRDIVVQNIVLQNVIGQGIDFLAVTNGHIFNNTVISAGDNPITAEGSNANYNCTIEYNTVIGGQDVGINTFHANNVTIRYNTVTNVTQYNGASHWGIAAENSAFVNIIGNTVSGCAQNIVSVSDDVLIAQNNVTGGNPAIEIQNSHRNIVRDNTITSNVPLGTYGSSQTFDAQFINNNLTGSNHISGTGTIIDGGSMYSTSADGAISLRSAINIQIMNVTFTGSNGVLDYNQQSNGVTVNGNDFSALTGTKINLSHSINVSIGTNVGYP